MPDTARRIGDAVKAYMHDPAARDFGDLALEVFAYQYDRNPPYRRFCDRRGTTPASVGRWVEIPAIPTSAFKEVDLTCLPAQETFRTSGTTRGDERRGRHLVADPELYTQSLLGGVRRFLLPDRDRIRILSLIPSGDEEADSSLSHMADVILTHCGAGESGTYVRGHRTLLGGLFAALHRASVEEEPVLLLGTTLAFVPVLEAAREAGVRCQLPSGSRLMDTGGTKGQDREFDQDVLLSRYGEVFGLPAAACVNEYGMTEMLSQFYNADLVTLAGAGFTPTSHPPPDRARKQAPPWVRSRVLDPDTLEDADQGILCHYDLANCHSVLAVQTEDYGERDGDGFRLVGRLPGAESRGCSIAMDEWLR